MDGREVIGQIEGGSVGLPEVMSSTDVAGHQLILDVGITCCGRDVDTVSAITADTRSL